MSTIDDLRAKGLIESVDTDSTTSKQWIHHAARHVDAAKRIADIDP